MKLGRMLKAQDYYLEPISEDLIKEYKSSENMLRHARYIPSKSNGWFMFDFNTHKPIGYII